VKYSLKVVVTTTDDSKYERWSAFTATNNYIPGEGDDPTGIQQVEHSVSDTKRFNNDWYTLDGRRVNPDNLQPGLYIHQGRKIVIK
jgi:hypothetical protein